MASTVYNPFTKKLDYVGTSTVVTEGASNPGSGATGELFYNTTDTTLYIYNGGWVAIGASGGSGVTTGFLLEDGTSLFLLEDGTSFLLQEA